MDIEKIKQVILPLLIEMGFSLVDLKWKTIEGKKVLEITIDKPNGVNISDCQMVSKKIEKLLDEKNLIEERYYLVVFSKGIEEDEN